jgi:hypothetical protein
MRARAVLVACLMAGLLQGGCVFKQRKEMVEAREAYQECVDENSETAERACAELKAEADIRSERYEQDAQTAWGCGEARGRNCDPTERAPTMPDR